MPAAEATACDTEGDKTGETVADTGRVEDGDPEGAVVVEASAKVCVGALETVRAAGVVFGLGCGAGELCGAEE